jgi:DNA-binding transcriptional LysR family regulator
LTAELGSEPTDSVAFIGFGDNFGPAPGRRWIEANVRPGRLVAKANSSHCMLQLALQGFGATLLPCFLGDRCSDLTRVGYLLPELDLGLWMLTHSDLRRSARVRAFMDFAGAELIKHRRAIEGEEPGGTG